MTRLVQCVKMKKEAEGLDFPPLPGELGKRIFESICKEAWDEWVRLQTMMINEYMLNCADPKVRKHLREQCEHYLFGDGMTFVPENFVPVENGKEDPTA